MWSERPRPLTDGLVVSAIVAFIAAFNVAACHTLVERAACYEIVVPMSDKPVHCPKGTQAEVSQDSVVCRCPGKPVTGDYALIPNADDPIHDVDAGLLSL